MWKSKNKDNTESVKLMTVQQKSLDTEKAVRAGATWLV